MAKRKYVARSKQRVHRRWFVDGAFTGERTYLEWVYERPDGTLFVNLKRPRDVTFDGTTYSVDMHAKTVQAMSGTQLLAHLQARAGGAPIVVVTNPADLPPDQLAKLLGDDPE